MRKNFKNGSERKPCGRTSSRSKISRRISAGPRFCKSCHLKPSKRRPRDGREIGLHRRRRENAVPEVEEPPGTLRRQRPRDAGRAHAARAAEVRPRRARRGDRKSTRLNSSHQIISYAVFCLKKKNSA